MISLQNTPDTGSAIAQLEGLELADWLWAGGLLAGAILLGILARRFIARVAERHTGTFIARLLGRFAAALIFAIGLIYSLNQLGVSIGPLLGLLGLAGLAIALAFQDIFENVIAGILMSVRRPFEAGDQISTNGFEGTVEDINLRVVSLRTYDGVRVFVPNASVWSNPVVNYTHFDQRRTTLDVGVGYESDLDAVQSAIIETVGSIEGVADEPPPQAMVHEFGDSSINFAVRFWHGPRIADMWKTRDEVARALKQRLDADGIDIPFPQRVLHVESVPASLQNQLSQ